MFQKHSLSYSAASHWRKCEEAPATTQIFLDFFADGVKIFENSTSGSMTPLMCHIYSIGEFIVPVEISSPFLVAVYHGIMKFDPMQFFRDFLAEIESSQDAESGIILSLRYFIGDTPMQAVVKGM